MGVIVPFERDSVRIYLEIIIIAGKFVRLNRRESVETLSINLI